ncbi:MAG: hypothetical protein J3Q66DRAFT_424896 [Benniella sp.]|nr:MAG: hypothetical protein J3Q66DRAFT_424896 [Benniella sp.]
MPSPHPLELPEILPLVFAYLPLGSLPASARVSKTWYQACAPLIWNDIDLKDQPMAPIQSHSHLVKKVKIGHVSEEYTALRFPNLDSLELNTWTEQDTRTILFIMAHPTVTRLIMSRYYGDYYQPAFWDALLGFRNLRELAFSSTRAFGTNIDRFWQLCTLLERLDIYVHHDSAFNIVLPPGELPSIKHLSVESCDVNNAPAFIEIIRRCPHLTSITWHSQSQEKTFMEGLSDLLDTKALPCLEHLETRFRSVSNDLLTKIIQGMPRITTLVLGLSPVAFEMDFVTLLQPHFSNLRVLELVPCLEVKNQWAQVVMSSCPLLERLKVPSVDAHVVVEGKPWVCLRLKVLSLALCFDPPSTVSHLQPLIFDRLSKLTRLERWCNMRPYRRGATVDLRLEYGLDKLSTLRRLHTVILSDSVHEKMSDAEVDWILEHWKSLTRFNGRLNTHDFSVAQALRQRLKEHGIQQFR